jgi:hypothetical protein
VQRIEHSPQFGAGHQCGRTAFIRPERSGLAGIDFKIEEAVVLVELEPLIDRPALQYPVFFVDPRLGIVMKKRPLAWRAAFAAQLR